MGTSLHASQAEIRLLYDGGCPLCQFSADHYQPETGEMECIDVRLASPLKEKAILAGFDLDRGIIFQQNDTFYYGSEAMYRLALSSSRHGLYNKIFYYIFRSPHRSALLYPLLRTMRACLKYLNGEPRIVTTKIPHTSTIRHQLGKNWHLLHPAIQRRFENDPEEHEHVFYHGVMQRIECSPAGRLFAYLTRIIGNPLTPHMGKDVRMDVVLHRHKGKSGVCWRRTYYYPGRTPFIVTSVKREGRSGEMLECVGGGFGMILKVTAEQGNLHFRSQHYFWEWGRMRILLPHLLSPGQTHVIHEEVGYGWFRFILSMKHPYLGQTFYQEGIFREE